MKKNQPSYMKHNEIYIELFEKGYRGWGGSQFENRMKGWEKQLVSILDFLGNQRGRLLELGCGTGDVSLMFAKEGFQIKGIEISNAATERANGNALAQGLGKPFICGDVVNLEQVFKEPFDVIIDGNCLHCIMGEDRERLMRSIHKLLTPKGIFVVSSVILNEFTDEVRITDERLERVLISETQLEAELKSAGFDIAHKMIRKGDEHSHFFAFLTKTRGKSHSL